MTPAVIPFPRALWLMVDLPAHWQGSLWSSEKNLRRIRSFFLVRCGLTMTEEGKAPKDSSPKMPPHYIIQSQILPPHTDLVTPHHRSCSFPPLMLSLHQTFGLLCDHLSHTLRHNLMSWGLYLLSFCSAPTLTCVHRRCSVTGWFFFFLREYIVKVYSR